MRRARSTRAHDRLRTHARAWHWRAIEQGRMGWSLKVQPMIRQQFRKEFRAISAAIADHQSVESIRNASEDVIAQFRDSWQKLLQRIYKGVAHDFGKIALKQLMPAKRHIDIEALETRQLGNSLQRWIRSESARKVKWISETTLALLQEALAKGMTEGESIGQLQDRIKQLDEIQSPIRALRIARSEVTNVSNAGQVLQVIDETEIDKTIAYKEWLTSRDEHVRETHQKADGQRVLANEAFQINGNELRWPADSGLGAEVSEVVNCRCTLLWFESQS